MLQETLSFNRLLIDNATAKIMRSIVVPKELSEITTYNPEDEVEPQLGGITLEAKNSIWTDVEDLFKTGISPGLVFTLRRHGHVILNRAIGYSHNGGPGDSYLIEKRKITPDTPICQFSASKAVTAMLIHLLSQQNKLRLLDPVCNYIPEFAEHGKEKISIYHLLTHRGGIPSPPKGVDTELLYDPEGFVKLLCKSKPKFLAGHKVAYHAITAGAILGEIIQRITNRDIREFLRESIQKPLAFHYFNYGVPDDEISEVAQNYSTGLPLFYPLSAIAKNALGVSWDEVVRISNQRRFLQTVIPAGNLVATSDEMSQFFQLLLNGGTLNGVKIFEPNTIKRATMEATSMQLDGTMIIPMRYSPGFMLGNSPVGLWGPFSQSSFGHVGFINILIWADPIRDISVSLQTTGKSLIGKHLLNLARLLSTISWQCYPEKEKKHYSEKNRSSLELSILKVLWKSLMSW